MKARTDAHRGADKRYSKKLKRVLLPFNTEKPEDAELYKILCEQVDKTAFIKSLIKSSIKPIDKPAPKPSDKPSAKPFDMLMR